MNQSPIDNDADSCISWINTLAQSVNKTPVVEKILNINWWFVVNVDNSKIIININENEFYVSFPVVINSNLFVIIISWNNTLLKDWLIKWREHPFLSNPFNIRKMSYLDIKIWMRFTLQKMGSTEIIKTNDQFWKQLRQRIPSSHPLSLNPNNR